LRRRLSWAGEVSESYIFLWRFGRIGVTLPYQKQIQEKQVL
jgi:hypothetical protein